MAESTSATPAAPPAGRSSHTAAKIARAVVFVAHDPVHATLLPPGAAESIERLSIAAGILKPWTIRLLAQAWYRRWVDGIAGRFAPGELLRLTLRKRFVDDEVRAAIGEGARQVLIFGPGFDTLGPRTAEAFPAVTVVEIDRPSTAVRRRRALERIGAVTSNLHVLAADLGAQRLHDVLHQCEVWDHGVRTVVIAEGVMMYLVEEAVLELLAAIRGSTGTGSRVVFSYVVTDDRGRPDLGPLSALNRVSLRLAGEPLRWAVEEGTLAAFLSRADYRIVGSGSGEAVDLRARYLVPAGIDQPLGNLERFTVAAPA